MKKMDFCEMFGDINEMYIKEARVPKIKKKKMWMKYSTIAACLCILFVGGYSFLNIMQEQHEQPEPNIPQEVDSPVIENRFVEISSLIGDDNISEETAEITTVPIDKYIGVYMKVSSKISDLLSESVGNTVEGTKEWYHVSGHSDAQYLIQNKNEIYSLWKFQCFESNEYPYSDVLKFVYQINSAEQFSKIIVNPATMDNTDAGKKVQEKIGTHVITDRSEIETIYEILLTLTCYGDDRWDMIDYGNSETAVDETHSSNEAVWLGRYLTLVTDYGNKIDGLKYTAVSNMFYEYSGIAYNVLSEKQATDIETIFHIDKSSETIQVKEQAEVDTQKTLLEEETIDSVIDTSNEMITLEYITELQTKISKAMANGELPFALSSAVYENPYRLHIVVTSNDESDMLKLKAYDTNGDALEIEYAPNNKVVKEAYFE